ncbi:hypothetical protein PtA15_13A172 [Puccinia triticina]|uniref:Uncharacterized protein n=1 Tax=Puccinia triticina TaxID=208348 RepID=A0ABY7CZN0_9BASI|nr:uncharacterized protein PtA15_13A172 [Puccinia triticina]WAQ90773.1 hypothetical protein PtA15_13A172 [Puccinia triticina]
MPTRRKVLAPEQTDDQHLKGLKSYQFERLKRRFNHDAIYHINEVCALGHVLFHQIKLAPAVVKPAQLDGCIYRNDFIKDVRYASYGINSIIKSIEASELNLAQEKWAVKLPCINEKIWEIIHAADILQTKQSTEPENLQVRKAAKLAKLSIPMIKLIKIFLTKISKQGINQKRFPTYTKMSLEQNNYLAHLVAIFGEDFKSLQLLYPKIEATGFGAATSRETVQIANDIESHVITTLSPVLMYYLPLIKDTNGIATLKEQ